jgi:5S rRNA maturation endonuclease (ribonuclease M5)
MWKLNWFLRDFGYDAELLGKNEIDDKALIDLWGVVKVSEVRMHGISVLNFDGFAPAAQWEEVSVFADSDPGGSEVVS